MEEQTISMTIDVDGAQSPFGLVRLSADELERQGAHMFSTFRTQSAAHGLAMSEEEIRDACWAPLATKLAQMTDRPLVDRAEAEKTFARRALAFFVIAAFGGVKPGERFVVELAGTGEMSLFRRPHRLLGRNRHVFGNYRTAMLAPAAALGQVG